MKRVIAVSVFALFLLSVSAFANTTGRNFKFYVTDNVNGAGIHAASVEVEGMTVCVTTNGSC